MSIRRSEFDIVAVIVMGDVDLIFSCDEVNNWLE